jgi:hypothetical protein
VLLQLVIHLVAVGPDVNKIVNARGLIRGDLILRITGKNDIHVRLFRFDVLDKGRDDFRVCVIGGADDDNGRAGCQRSFGSFRGHGKSGVIQYFESTNFEKGNSEIRSRFMLAQRPHVRQENLRSMTGAGGVIVGGLPECFEWFSQTLWCKRGDRWSFDLNLPERSADFAECGSG